MKGHGTQFALKKEAAIAALLTQRNIEEAARSIDISANTLLKWMKEPEFDVAYREARIPPVHRPTATGVQRRGHHPAQGDGGAWDAAIHQGSGRGFDSGPFGESD